MEKTKMISYCGLVCSECPAYVAKRRNDDDLRQEAAAQWSKQYDADIKPRDMNCDGCIVRGGEHFTYCNECEVRSCAQERFVDTCAHCPEYSCDKLSALHEMSPIAKANLDLIKDKLNPAY
jgi:hypothetical protein